MKKILKFLPTFNLTPDEHIKSFNGDNTKINNFNQSRNNRPQSVQNMEKLFIKLGQEGILNEYKLILSKVSKLSRTQRDVLTYYVEHQMKIK